MLFPLAKVTVHVVSLRWWGVGPVTGVPLVVVGGGYRGDLLLFSGWLGARTFADFAA